MLACKRVLVSSMLVIGALWMTPALADQPLTITNSNAHAVACVVNANCAIVVTDSIGTFTLQGDGGTGRFITRTGTGMLSAAAGFTKFMVYEYRVDLSAVVGTGNSVQPGVTANMCITQVSFPFIKEMRLSFRPGDMSDIFVETSGGIGSVGIASASYGYGLTVVFAQPICPGASSFVFGYASQSTTPLLMKGGASLVTSNIIKNGTHSGQPAYADMRGPTFP